MRPLAELYFTAKAVVIVFLGLDVEGTMHRI